jgi:hypothetical protein
MSDQNELMCFNSFYVIGLNFPLMVCDLYYGYNDESCLNQSEKNNLEFDNYLVISGFIMLSEILLFAIILLNKHLQRSVKKIIYLLVLLFNISWIITGMIIFWKYTNMNECSKIMLSYASISFAMKLASHLIALKCN